MFRFMPSFRIFHFRILTFCSKHRADLVCVS